MAYWTQEKRVKRLWDLCLDCAESIYGIRPPNIKYAFATACLLFGTAAQESNFIWARQRNVPWIKRNGDSVSFIGGISLFQLEKGSIQESIKLLKCRPDIAQKVTDWLFCDSHADPAWITTVDVSTIMQAMILDDNHKLPLAFARLHYFRFPEPIPNDKKGWAKMWKLRYNTIVGKGTEEQFLQNFDRLCLPIIKESEQCQKLSSGVSVLAES